MFQASLAAVKQEAVVSTLRRQLESHGNRGAALIQQRATAPLLAARRTGYAATTTPWPATPTARAIAPDGRRGGSDNPCALVGNSGGGGGSDLSTGGELDDLQQHPRSGSCDGRRLHPRTPTTDILRRLLYEKTPPASSSSTPAAAPTGGEENEASGGKNGNWCAAAEDGSDPHARRRSRRGRRLFADGSAALRADPANDPDDVASARRGPAALFSDSACGVAGAGEAAMGVRGRERRSCGGAGGAAAVEERDDNRGRASPHGGGLEQAAGIAVQGDRFAGEVAGGGPATGEEGVLRERLLQARREFSALRSGAPPVDV